MRAAMTVIDEVRLLPDAEQHTLLAATLERVNRASNAARVAALQRNVFEGAALREIVKAELERARLPDLFATPMSHRVEASLRKRTGKQPKFSAFQALAFPASALKWTTSDRVAMPTSAGRRTIAVRVDRARGDLRPPLSGRPVALVYRNGEFDLVATDVERDGD